MNRDTDLSSDEESIHSIKTSNSRVCRKSREELNEIEKQRTRRINEQILSIRGLLDVSNVPTRKDKYSVLCSAHDFILSLIKTVDECRLKLDKKFLTSKNSECSKFYPERFVNPMMAGVSDSSLRPGYDHLLKYSRSPMALMTIDAKFVNCNESFCLFTGFSSDELLMMSLFNLSTAENLKSLFKSVGTLIDQSGTNAQHTWHQFQFKYKLCLCYASFWIVENNEGNPVLIQMMLVSVEDSISGVGQSHSQSTSSTSRTISPSPLHSSPTTAYTGRDSRMGYDILPRGDGPTHDEMWTDKQRCVTLLRQKFAEQQTINPNRSILPLLKIREEYGKIQQQQQQQHQQQQLILGEEVVALPPLPSLYSSSSTSSSTWQNQTEYHEPQYKSLLNDDTNYSMNNDANMITNYHHHHHHYHHPLFLESSSSPQDYYNHNIKIEQSLTEDHDDNNATTTTTTTTTGNAKSYTKELNYNIPL